MNNLQAHKLNALGPLDGRYYDRLHNLRPIFSERGLILYRIKVEVLYLLQLLKTIHPELLNHKDFPAIETSLKFLYCDLNPTVTQVKIIEQTINHDVKSIEYYIKQTLEHQAKTSSPSKKELIHKIIPFIHFGLTSQDITTISLWLQLKDVNDLFIREIHNIEQHLRQFFNKHKALSMLSKTHGQPASPTTLGKEFMVFAERLDNQLQRFQGAFSSAKVKFGGAIGNLNAHVVSYPQINWIEWANNFVQSFGLTRAQFTTQIDHYDGMADIFDCTKRINVILIDLCRDIWSYISQKYFVLSIDENEVGSSAMPHKVNPINFENAEGNLQLGNCMFEFFSRKLPISRMQRDLSDSTVVRNFGVAFGYSFLAYSNILKGLKKINPNLQIIAKDLNDSHIVVAEAIQTILKTNGISNAYELLKEFTRQYQKPTQQDFEDFIQKLDVCKITKKKLLSITPHNYIGSIPIDYK